MQCRFGHMGKMMLLGILVIIVRRCAETVRLLRYQSSYEY